MSFFNFSSPTKLTFGVDSLNEIGRIASSYGKRALIITDHSSLAETGIVDSIKASITAKGMLSAVFGDINSECDSAAADVAANMAQNGKSDVIIAAGGSSTLNYAKAVATVATNSGEAGDYASLMFDSDSSDIEYIKNQMVLNEPMPLICIPTIVGSVSEITAGYNIRDKYDGVIKQSFSKKIYARECVFDPKIQLTIPTKFLVTSAIMIYAFSLEVFIGTHYNAIADSMAARAMELVLNNLKNMVENQVEIEYRQNISMASVLCSLAANSSMLGAMRAISLAAQSTCGVYPGVMVAILLPHIMEFNMTAATAKFIQVVKQFGEDTRDLSIIEAAIKSVELIRRFLADFNLPSHLSEANISRGDFEKIAKLSLCYGEMENLPRPMSHDDIVTLLEQSF